MPALYPLLLNLELQNPLIVGGGKVAIRKARGLLAAGARSLRVVSPRIDPEMPREVLRIPQSYSPEVLSDATLVFAATDNPAVNQQVVEDCHQLRILVCRVDDPDSGDFITPAIHRDGDLSIAVSASGSPALAALVRDQIAKSLDPQLGQLARLLALSRETIRNSPLNPAQRAQLHRKIAADGLEFLKNNPESAFPLWINALINDMK